MTTTEKKPRKLIKIYYCTGAGDIEGEFKSLDEAKKAADEGIAYTQESVVICDENDNEITRRTWVGCHSDFEDQENPIDYDSFGYYTDWSN